MHDLAPYVIAVQILMLIGCGVIVFIGFKYMGNAKTLEPIEKGVELQNAGKETEAIEKFNEAIKIDPKAVRAYIHRGLCYFSLHDYQSALADFNTTVSLDPTMYIHRIHRAHALVGLKQFEDALKDCDQAVSLLEKPTSVQNTVVKMLAPKLVKDYLAIAYKTRGDVHGWMGSYESSVADFSKAIEYDVTYKEAYEIRARIYDRIGKAELAEADRKKVAELSK